LLMSSAGSVLNVMAAENVARKSKMSKICEKFRTGLSVDTFEICIQNISHSFRTSRCRGWNSNVLLLKFSFRISTWRLTLLTAISCHFPQSPPRKVPGFYVKIY